MGFSSPRFSLHSSSQAWWRSPSSPPRRSHRPPPIKSRRFDPPPKPSFISYPSLGREAFDSSPLLISRIDYHNPCRRSSSPVPSSPPPLSPVYVPSRLRRFTLRYAPSSSCQSTPFPSGRDGFPPNWSSHLLLSGEDEDESRRRRRVVLAKEGPKFSRRFWGSFRPCGDTRNGEQNSRIMMFGDIPADLEATPNYPFFFTSSFNCNESPGKKRAAQERDIGTDCQKSPKHREVRTAPEVVHEEELASYDTSTHRRSDGVVNFIKRRTRADLRNQGTTRSDSSIQVEKLHTSIGLKDTRSSSASNFVNKRKPFDICLPRRRRLDFAEPSDHIEDCEQTHEAVKLVEQESRVLRPGMVLLKNHITLREQIEIARKCREIGIGPGGFYQPVYQDGAKLRLQMMCLGLDWDPNTRKYERQRRVDGCTTPDIPNEFILAVERAMGDSQDLVRKCDRRSNLSNDLPTMYPNICIVNFYTSRGRLGLHQDRDESRESLRKGLPVVSFSIGDSAEFLFGDYRDVDRAERVMLESGDVVIFGGESRMVFHGISSVVLNSAPKALLDESGLRPGRLNLTFRQF